MAITFALVSRGPNHLTYLADSTGTTAASDTGRIQNTGAGDADVPLEDGFVASGGQIPVEHGLLYEIVTTAVANQAQAERLGKDVGLLIGAPNITNVAGHRARVSVTPESGLKAWNIVANVAGGRLVYDVACTAAGLATALVHIEAVGTPEKF